MSSCQHSPAEVLRPAASIMVLTTDQAADLKEASRPTLAAQELSGQQQQVAGLESWGTHTCC